MQRIWRRQFIQAAIAGALGCGSSGCGTILHPERRGQPAGPLDWKIVALDAVGLLFFFIPGVIAFAVDFATGAIYLPSCPPGAVPLAGATRELTTVRRSTDELTPAEIESIVSQHAQQKIQLTAGEFETVELDSVEQFWTKHDQFVAKAEVAS